MAIDVITLRGGVVADPELRTTNSGAQVAEFRIAQSDHRWNDQTKQWDKTKSLYLTCSIWDENGQDKQSPALWAQAAMAQIYKGAQITVQGKLVTDQWEDNGNKRSQIKFAAKSFAVEPNPRVQNQQQQQQQHQPQGNQGWNSQQGGFSGQSQQPPQNQGGFQGQQQQSFQNDPWNSAPPAGGATIDDEPPF